MSITPLNANPLSPTAFSTAPLNATPLRCISVTNQESKVRPKILNVNSDEPIFCPFSIKTSKCRVSCNNINDTYAKMCVTHVA